MSAPGTLEEHLERPADPDEWITFARHGRQWEWCRQDGGCDRVFGQGVELSLLRAFYAAWLSVTGGNLLEALRHAEELEAGE